MSAIQISGLSKTYATGFWHSKQKVGLKNLSLEVHEGEVFGCLGPNGAGKTTTLKILMGLVFPTSGKATILDRDIHDPEVKRQIGFLPEQPYFYDYLTAAELLEYFAQLSGVDAKTRRPRVSAMLSRVGLSESANVQLRKFSKGMLQRVGIAQAILHEPRIVFLDEPMSGLDPVGRREVREIIQQLNDEGRTVFFSTHILSDAEALCDRVAVLHQGELRGVGVVADLTAGATQGEVEIVFEGKAPVEALERMGAHCRIAGESVRAVLQNTHVDRALEVIRQAAAKLVSVNPLHRGLEEYFLSRVQDRSPGEAQP